MKILNVVFKPSEKKAAFLDKIEQTGEFIVLLMLILLSISYAIKNFSLFWALVVGGFSLIIIYVYVIIIVYQYLRYQYLIWEKEHKIKK